MAGSRGLGVDPCEQGLRILVGGLSTHCRHDMAVDCESHTDSGMVQLFRDRARLDTVKNAARSP